MTQPLRTALREGTRAAHDNVERHFAAFDLTHRDGYRNFLRAQAAAVIPLERALTQNGAEKILSDWPARQRAHAVIADLRVLDAELTEIAVTLPRTTAHMLATLYVLEGSRLGGAILLRAVERARIDVDDAMRFLRHGNDGRLWKTFLPVLEHCGAAHDPHTVVAAAIDTFDVFARAARHVAGSRASSAPCVSDEMESATW